MYSSIRDLHRHRPRLPLLVLCILPLLASAQPELDAARGVVDKLHASLLQAMQSADTLDFEGRYDLLAPVIETSFDFDSITRIVLGRHFEALSESETQAFKETFIDLTVTTYADNFDGFDGESFETVSVEQQRNTLLVRTRIVRPNDTPVSLDYQLRETLRDGTAAVRIVNVVSEGVSDIALKRADYGAVIGSEGFAALLNRLENQIETLADSR